MKWMAVEGTGLWQPGLGADPAVRLPPRLRRRASLLVRMVADVATQAAEQAGVSLTGIPVIMGSAYGELVTTMELLEELESPERQLSPFRFHNSVHNTAPGYLSMATDNQASCTALAAGNDTVAAVFLEAFSWLADRGGRVLAVVADEPLPEAIALRGSAPLATAFVLAAPAPQTASERPPLGWIGELQMREGLVATEARDVEVDCPSGTALDLLAALGQLHAEPHGRRVALSAGERPTWSVAVKANPPA